MTALDPLSRARDCKHNGSGTEEVVLAGQLSRIRCGTDRRERRPDRSKGSSSHNAPLPAADSVDGGRCGEHPPPLTPWPAVSPQ